MKRWTLFFFFIAAVAFAQKETLRVDVVGDTVIVNNENVWENCAARFNVRVESISKDQIIVIATDTVKQKARCMCHFDLTGRFVGIPPGKYELLFMREYLKKFNYPDDLRVAVGMVTFSISNAAVPVPTAAMIQSDCRNMTAIPEQMKRPDELSIEVIPNQLAQSSDATIVINGAATNAITIAITNSIGQTVATMRHDGSGGGQIRLQLPESMNLIAGLYTVTVVTNRSTASAKFIVLD